MSVNPKRHIVRMVEDFEISSRTRFSVHLAFRSYRAIRSFSEPKYDLTTAYFDRIHIKMLVCSMIILIVYNYI